MNLNMMRIENKTTMQQTVRVTKKERNKVRVREREMEPDYGRLTTTDDNLERLSTTIYRFTRFICTHFYQLTKQCG